LVTKLGSKLETKLVANVLATCDYWTLNWLLIELVTNFIILVTNNLVSKTKFSCCEYIFFH